MIHVTKLCRECKGGTAQLTASWRAPNSKVNAPRKKRCQETEDFRDFVRAVVSQHYPTTAYAHVFCMAGDVSQKNFGRRTGKLDAAVMFSEPISMVAQYVTGFR
jgi:predicted alpha/beta-fold hydrolase